jgi:hypothetical protein
MPRVSSVRSCKNTRQQGCLACLYALLDLSISVAQGEQESSRSLRSLDLCGTTRAREQSLSWISRSLWHSKSKRAVALSDLSISVAQREQESSRALGSLDLCGIARAREQSLSWISRSLWHSKSKRAVALLDLSAL